MEKIYFDDTTFIWKTNLNLTKFKSLILKECYDIIKQASNNITDAFPVLPATNILDYNNIIDVNSLLDEIMKLSIQSCIELHKPNLPVFNNLNTDGWINVVRATNPIQGNFNKDFSQTVLHRHIDITPQFHPNYTFVYYIQMPDNLNDNDGTLIIGGEKERYYYLPKEDDLIIMTGDLPHSPNASPNSSKDRIVLAGNVGIEYIKKKYTLI